jgi:uncharacterized protein (TIRG00374 family)
MIKRWQFWLGLIISALFLGYALYNLNLAQVWDAIQGARFAWLLPGVAVYFVGVWARTWRWHYMLRPIKGVSLRRLFPVVCIGYMGNNVYPARAGELIRAYVLRRKEGISVGASLATIVVERVFDGVVMLLFVFVGLPLAADLPGEWRSFVVVFSLLFFGALAVFFLMAASPRRAEVVYVWVIERIVPQRFRAPVRGFADRFMQGLRCLQSGRDVAMIFMTSLVIWLAETVKYWFVMHAFDFAVSFFVLMLMNGVVNLFTTIPSSPGYVGTFDAPGIETLESVGGVRPEMAVAYTLVLHAALWFPITALGGWYMWRESVSWQDLGRAARLRDEEGAAASD